MRKALVIMLLSFLSSLLLFGQTQDQFVYRNLDDAILSVWLSADAHNGNQLALYNNLHMEWLKVRNRILTSRISHFDKEGFVEDQDLRLRTIKYSIANNKTVQLKNEAYNLLSEFKEVRMCFTNDEYLLDYMLDTYNSYLTLHDIIHDQMMGLYEWSEFIWFLDQLKCKVEILEIKVKNINPELYAGHNFDAEIDRIIYCLNQLDDSVQTAYQPNFIPPCDDTGAALIELFSQYSDIRKNGL